MGMPASKTDFDETLDEELVRQTRSGSLSCFEEIVRRHEGGLFRFLRRRTACLHDAEDLLQETFAVAYRKLDSYNPKWKLTTWLFTIAARLSASHHRRRAPGLLGDGGMQPDDQPEPVEVAAKREEKHKLWRLAEEALPASQFTALWLRYAEDMNIREIAKVMSKTQINVKVLLYRGRRVLAGELASWPAGEDKTGQALEGDT